MFNKYFWLGVIHTFELLLAETDAFCNVVVVRSPLIMMVMGLINLLGWIPRKLPWWFPCLVSDHTADCWHFKPTLSVPRVPPLRITIIVMQRGKNRGQHWQLCLTMRNCVIQSYCTLKILTKQIFYYFGDDLLKQICMSKFPSSAFYLKFCLNLILLWTNAG